MKLLRQIFFVLFLAATFYSCTPPQDYVDSPEHYFLFEKNRFFIDPLVFLDKDSLKPRLDLYIGIPSENILFKKTGANGNYEMKLNITVTLKGDSSYAPVNKKYDLSATYTEDEMKKISRAPQFRLYSYFPDPGKYKIEVKLYDENAKREYRKKEELNINYLSPDNFSCSDLMVLSNYRENENGTKEISPLVTNNISGLNDVNIFFEVYSKPDSASSKELILKIKNPKGDYIKEEIIECPLVNSVNKIFRRVLSRNEFIMHKPDKKDFEDFEPGDRNFGNLLLELWDKQENKIIATKKLSVLPEKNQRPPEMERGKHRH